MRKLIILIVLLVAGGAGAVYWLFYHKSTSAVPAGASYLVSLGDSVAAGDGLPAGSYTSSADIACARSDYAYPQLMATQLKLQLAQLACSGATVTSGLLGEQTAQPVTLPPQIATASPHIKGNVVVLTIGANDVGWSDLLVRCIQTACDSPAASQTYTAALDQLSSNLAMALSQIRAYQPARLLVNTYYHPVEPTDSCLQTFGIDQTKVNWVLAREADLNQAITIQAHKQDATVVDVNFSGHELCNFVNSYIQGPNAVAPLHPTAAGQQQIAQQVIQAL